MKKKREKMNRRSMTEAIMLLSTITVLLAAWVPSDAVGKTIFVKADAAGTGTGASWANSFRSLQDGLRAAITGDQVWVAAGIYRPDQGTGLTPSDRAAFFHIKPGVAVYGGFAGSETLLSQRDLQKNKSILSGDLLGNDGPDFANVQDNSYHVVMGHYSGERIVLDGVTITGGNADGSPDNDDRGGGMFLTGAALDLLNSTVHRNMASRMGGGAYLQSVGATISNTVFDKNDAWFGGAIVIYGNTITISDSAFTNNHARNSGGGVECLHTQNLTAVNSIFRNNRAAFQGAGITAESFDDLVLKGCLFSRNSVYLSSSHNGGAGLQSHGLRTTIDGCVFESNTTSGIGGGLKAHATSSFSITNSIIRANRADSHGGGMYLGGKPAITNCAIMNNSAAAGGGLYFTFAPTVTNSVIWGNNAPQGKQISFSPYGTGQLLTIGTSVLQGGTAAIDKQRAQVAYNNSMNADPLLTADGHLRKGSPCIDAGSVAPSVTVDIDGETRPAGARYDIGADEFLDTDGDGLPDYWEQRGGLNPLDNGSTDVKNGPAGDPDGDGHSNLTEYLNATPPQNNDNDGDGFTAANGDCNDLDRMIHPNADEICDTIDNNCDGLVDDDDPAVVGRSAWHQDGDADSYGNPTMVLLACKQPVGYVANGTDCNDLNPAINPGAPEVCDGIDNNCDNRVDDADPSVTNSLWHLDSDGDGFGNPSVSASSCNRPAGYVADNTDCGAGDPAVNPNALEICGDGVDNNCDGVSDGVIECKYCTYDAQCGAGEYCAKSAGTCDGVGVCEPLPAMSCAITVDPVCGCNGATYQNSCQAETAGMNIAAPGDCAASTYKWRYYFPSIKDDNSQGWENYLTVQAKDPVPMDVTIRVYDMGGKLVGTHIYSNTDPLANEAAVAPYARVAQRPSMIVGSIASPVPVEGSLIIDTSVPAIATTNMIANNWEGFSIYEAAKPRSVHSFPKAYDGPNNYQVYLLIQNIYDTPINVTIKLLGKTPLSLGHGATRTTDIAPFGTLKVRPSEIADGINFDGSVVVTSNLAVPEDGIGPAIPAMCRYELGKEAMSIYESTVVQPALYFPVLRDGKFGGSLDFQNYLSVVNPGIANVTVTIVLYNTSGQEKGRESNFSIGPGGKRTWRPGFIAGTSTTPADFEGSAVVHASHPVVGQTNTIYPGKNTYNTDAFDLFESSMSGRVLFFPKGYDNIVGDGHLFDNYVYVQNADNVKKTILIEQFNNNGKPNGSIQQILPPNGTHVFRPKSLVTDGTGQFRGSIRITEISGLKIAGALKYEIHRGATPADPINCITIYRSMGQ